jgi:hypothetical protein
MVLSNPHASVSSVAENTPSWSAKKLKIHFLLITCIIFPNSEMFLGHKYLLSP